jgi:hypothetical protein
MLLGGVTPPIRFLAKIFSVFPRLLGRGTGRLQRCSVVRHMRLLD